MTLEYVANKKRNIRSGKEFEKLFPPVNWRDDIVKKDGNVKDTVRDMEKVVYQFLGDTKKLAPLLKGKTLKETCNNLWNFIYLHVQYHKDKEGTEELRRPARSYAERVRGVDCDCYSIFASSVLTNLGVRHQFRITKYFDEQKQQAGDWQHVYVVVPGKRNEIIIDCVLEEFNSEKPYHEKFDYSMNGIPIAVLSGFSNSSETDKELLGILSGSDFTEIEFLNGIGRPASSEKELDALYQHIIKTRDYILKNPHSVLTSGGANAHLSMLNYAIENWNTPNRDAALEKLAEEEEKWNKHNGLSGEDDYTDGYGDIDLGKIETEDEDDDLGRLFKRKNKEHKPKKEKKKRFWNFIKTAVKGVGKGLKKVWRGVKRFNPVSIASRNGYLLAMKLNLFHWSAKLAPGYMSESEAKAKGISSEQWNKAKKALARVHKIFVDVLAGKEEALKKNIMRGAGLKGLEGFGDLGELGEPATATAVTAAAVPLMSTAAAMKSEGVDTGEGGESDKTSFIKKIWEWLQGLFKRKNLSESDAKLDEGDAEANETGGGGEGGGEGGGGGDEGDGENTFDKIKTLVKENPVPVFIGGTALVVLIIAALQSKNKSKNNNSQQVNGLNGTRKRYQLTAPKKQKLQLLRLK